MTKIRWSSLAPWALPVAALLWLPLMGCPDDPDREDTAALCSDGEDNDNDLMVDCLDIDCSDFCEADGDSDTDADTDVDGDADEDGDAEPDGDADADDDDGGGGDGDADDDGDAEADADADGDEDADPDADGDAEGDADADSPVDTTCTTESDCVLALNFRVCCPCPEAISQALVDAEDCILEAAGSPTRPFRCGVGCDPSLCGACPAPTGQPGICWAGR